MSTHQPENEQFPFTRPEGSEVDMFIQWKGTQVCLDLTCRCGAAGHLDATFAHYVQCPACGAVYQMGTQVIAKRTNDVPQDASVVTLDVDDEPNISPANPKAEVVEFSDEEDDPRPTVPAIPYGTEQA